MAMRQMRKITAQMIPKPKGVLAKGIHFSSTFIPYMPEMMVGMAITMVMDASYFMAVFSRLSLTELSSSLVPLMMSR